MAPSIAEQTRTLAGGDFGHVPPRTVHAYANRSQVPVRFLAWTVEGPIDQFFEALSRRVKQMPQDAPAMAEITARYGVTMAGGPG